MAGVVCPRRASVSTAVCRRVNPWNGTADTAAERVLSRMWARGYTAGNPFAMFEF